MEISLIISGNLTGFSRFYASPNANDVYNEAKFDFDYRNFLTFLNAGEKAYAISFSPKIIAVSLITRILDSFRRPGILVITALVPRYQLVRGQLNQNDKTAIFKLLNEINDKFYEKNFLNGMVNQNPAVLMQDYYSDILSRYVFVNDRMQKPVNSRIDVTSPNKRIGYVAAAEGSMPQYLSSVMRKSYEGYHHVFLSPHAPQNIDEPAEEILTYKVRIENGNRPVPGEVRLTDRIPNVNPEQGEKDIPNKNFTYGQVISGEAGTDIIGTIENGETIVLSYRFPKEEKTVYFRFYDGANEVPIALIRPFIVDSNGSSFNIPSDSYTFYGKEIYGRKTIKSGNSEYSIVGPVANLDLQRVQDGATININVERGWLWQFAPMRNNLPATIKPVNITLTNRFNGDRRSFPNVTSAISEKLSGNPSEWEMVIESNYYKDVRIQANSQYRLEPKPVQQHPVAPTGTNGKDGRTVSLHNRTTSSGQNGQGLKISKGDQHTAKDSEQIRREKNKRYVIYGVSFVVGFLLVFGGIWIYKALSGKGEKGKTGKEEQAELIVDLPEEVKLVTFKLIDSDGDELSPQLARQLSVSITPEQTLERVGDGQKYEIKYHPEKKDTEKIKLDVKFKDINMLATDYTPILEIVKINDVENVRLSVKGSDIKLFETLSNKIAKTDFANYSEKVQKVMLRNNAYGMLLAQELAKSKPEEAEAATPPASPKTPSTTTTPTPVDETKNPGIVNKDFDEDWLSLEKLNGMKANTDEEKARKRALQKVLGRIKSGNCPESADDLSAKQAVIVNQLIERNRQINALPENTPEEKKHKKEVREAFSKAMKAKSPEGEISIKTSRGALKIRL